jgi:imidazolonepropionase-like amidohydrolase
MKYRKSFVATILSGILSTLIANAADVTFLQAGAVLDVVSGQLIPNQTITIEGDRIVSIDDSAGVVPPSGSTVLDLSDKTVLPGLIDAHTHLLADADDQGLRRMVVSLPEATLNGVKNAAITLNAGFTTVRMVGAPGYADVALRDAIEAGEIKGPRLLVAGPPIGITGGHCSDNSLLPYEYGVKEMSVADGPWEVRRMVRQHVKFGVDLIKTCSTGGVLSKGTKLGSTEYTLEELQAMVHEAHAHGRKVAVHAHGTVGINNAIRAGVDSVEHASFLDEESIKLAKERGTVFVMDVYVTEHILSEGEQNGMSPESIEKERQVGSMQRENFTKAHRAGVKMVFGTDSAVYPHGNNGKQFAYMVRFGMSPLEAIQAATINAAELLGVSELVGQLSVGRKADLVAVTGNPIEDISLLENIEFVMKDGEVYQHR